jgi:hypothetical protein
MNLQKEKALFFAQYLGQKCNYFSVASNQKQDVVTVNGFIIDEISNWITRFNRDPYTLLLRSVDQLTDKEKIQCYHLHSAAIAYDYTQDFADILTMANHWLKNDGIKSLFKYSWIKDYLRLIGIIVPFSYIDETGKPVTLQPEEIIALNWAQHQK